MASNDYDLCGDPSCRHRRIHHSFGKVKAACYNAGCPCKKFIEVVDSRVFAPATSTKQEISLREFINQFSSFSPEQLDKPIAFVDDRPQGNTGGVFVFDKVRSWKEGTNIHIREVK